MSSEQIVTMTLLDPDKKCHCWRCDYEWVSRKEKVPPAFCPRCRADNWSLHREFKCQECSYIFNAGNVLTPAYNLYPTCPNCQSSAWHGDCEAELRELYTDGMLALQTENWEVARQKFIKIQVIKSDYEDVADNLEKVKNALILQWTLERQKYGILGVLPKDISTIPSRYNPKFDGNRCDDAAGTILKFCQARGNWEDFTLAEINSFHRKINNSKETFSFGELIEKRYIRKVGWISRKFAITRKFVAQLMKK